MKVDLNSLHEDMLSCCKSYRENPQRYSRSGMKFLKWLSWYGMLYANHNLCYISLKELYHRGLIFG